MGNNAATETCMEIARKRFENEVKTVNQLRKEENQLCRELDEKDNKVKLMEQLLMRKQQHKFKNIWLKEMEQN